MEITKKNFAEELDNITQNLKRSCFVGFDAEFSAILSGEAFKYRYLYEIIYVQRAIDFPAHNIDFTTTF